MVKPSEVNLFEERFNNFLEKNSIKQEPIKEEYGDFYLIDFNLVIELKTTLKTNFTKIIDKSVYKGVRCIPLPNENSLKIEDANKKAKRLRECNDKKLKSLTFLCLIDINEGYDIKLEEIMRVLTCNPTRWISSLKLTKNGVFDYNNNKYFIPIEDKNSDRNEQQLRYVDYFGVLRKNNDYKKWKIQLIENPLIESGLRLKIKSSFFEIFTPVYI